MRFGAMLLPTKDTKMAALKWHRKKKILELKLTKEAHPLFGEVAEARFNALAQTLGAEVKISKKR